LPSPESLDLARLFLRKGGDELTDPLDRPAAIEAAETVRRWASALVPDAS
jgi:hypothetical protein